MLKRIYPYFKPYRNQCVLALLVLFSVHILEAAIPLYLKDGIDLIARNNTDILQDAAAILTLTLLRFLVLNYGRRRNALVSIGLASALRRALYGHLLTLGRSFYAQSSLGDLMARAINDIAAIQRFFRAAVHQLVSLVSVALIAPVFMAQQSLLLTLLLLPLLIAIGVAGGYLAERIRRASEHQQAEYGSLTELVQQNLKGIRTIQAHAQEDREIRHFADATQRYVAANQRLVRLNAVLDSAMLLGSGLMSLVVAGVGGSQVLNGQMSIGALTAFLLYLSMILSVIRNCSTPVYHFLNASTAAARVFQVMDEQPEIQDIADESISPVSAGAMSIHNLSFSYADKTGMCLPPVLHDISLTIYPGELVAIIGPIGAGKSTLLSLLSRQLEPGAGQICLDGQDLKSIPLSHLRRSVSFVTQDSFLFAAAIAENIAYDYPQRSQDSIWAAANAAQLAETITGFGSGLSTLIGERGVTLSGGQKQRASLARSLIRQTPILLLDDSFSALDTETGALILAHLRSLRHSQTTIMVTHRVANARNADRIVVLDKGRIIETGNHAQLLALNGHYADLVRQQNQSANLEPAI
jgi:ATP-binding cassette subfamily B protein